MHMSDTLRSVTRRSALALFAAFLALQRSPAEAEFPAILVCTENLNADVVMMKSAEYRPDQPFGKSILPRRGWGGRLVPDAHGAQSACDDGTIDAIPVSD